MYWCYFYGVIDIEINIFIVRDVKLGGLVEMI